MVNMINNFNMERKQNVNQYPLKLIYTDTN